MKQYSYSFDEERYHGPYASPMQAAAEAFYEQPENEVVWIGENVPPPQPETLIDGALLIDYVKEQDEYTGEWADGWPRVNREKREELTKMIRATFAEWLDKHQCRPGFWTVENVLKITREEMDAHFAQRTVS